MVNIIIYDNDGNELYRFKDMYLSDIKAIIEGTVLINDHQILIEKSVKRYVSAE